MLFQIVNHNNNKTLCCLFTSTNINIIIMILLLLLIIIRPTQSFFIKTTSQFNRNPIIQQQQKTITTAFGYDNKFSKKLIFRYNKNNDNDDGDHNNEDDNNQEQQQQQPIVTKEMLIRDMLKIGNDDEVTVQHKNKKRNKKSQYKVLDNRDTMPFAVTLQTPDPYTHPDIKKSNAAKVAKKKNYSAIEEQIVSRVIMSNQNNQNNLETLLGEYTLDKHTTTGDILFIQDIQYKVIRHRFQYKYVGGQRFVMIKKILEVKEIQRLETEELLNKLINNE